MTKISCSLSSNSVSAAIKALEDYKKWITECNIRLCNKLGMLVVEEAQRLYGLAAEDGNSDVEVIGPIQTENGFKVIAGGTDVIFAEFGAGGGVSRDGNYKNVPAYVQNGSYSRENNGPYAKSNYTTWTYGGVKYSVWTGFPYATHAMSNALDKAVSELNRCVDLCFKH